MKSQSYNNFWQHLHKSAKDKGFPLRVMFELTYRCNFLCPHCYVPLNYRGYNELKTREIFYILDELGDIGCFYLGFTGGEPFVREDIMEILRYARKKGFEVIIYTNGSLINEKIADELAHLRPNKVDITISGMSKIAFERVSGVSGYRDRVFKAIELLYKKGVNLGFKSCVLKENEDEIEKIRKFAASLGALHRLDDMLSRRLDGSAEPYRYRGASENNSITSHQASLSKLEGPSAISNDELKECDLETENLTSRDDNLFKCGVGETQAAITPSGELKMCLMIDYPKYKLKVTPQASHLMRHSLKGAWEKMKELVKSIRPDENYECDKCELQPYCKWCPARAWLYNKSFTSCTPESRKKAEWIKSLYEKKENICTKSL